MKYVSFAILLFFAIAGAKTAKSSIETTMLFCAAFICLAQQ